MRRENQTFTIEGAGVEDNDGYQYFGEAKNLKHVDKVYTKEVP